MSDVTQIRVLCIIAFVSLLFVSWKALKTGELSVSSVVVVSRNKSPVMFYAAFVISFTLISIALAWISGLV